MKPLLNWTCGENRITTTAVVELLTSKRRTSATIGESYAVDCGYPSQSSRSWCAVGLRNRTAASTSADAEASTDEITEPLRPATKQTREDSNPDQ